MNDPGERRPMDRVTANWHLQALGTPEEVRERLERLREIRAYLSDKGIGAFTPARRDEQLLPALDEAREMLEKILEAVEEAEASLSQPPTRILPGRFQPATFNPERRRVEFPAQGGKGGRPRSILTDLVGAAWEHERPLYREETGDSPHNCEALRRRIVEWVRVFLSNDPEGLDPRPGGNVEDALRSYLSRRTAD